MSGKFMMCTEIEFPLCNYPRPLLWSFLSDQVMIWSIVWKGPAPARRAVSTAVRTAVSYSAAHMMMWTASPQRHQSAKAWSPEPLVRQSVTGFQINRQRVNAWPERRSLRDCRQSRGRRLAAMGTADGETPMPPYEWLNGRKLDLVIFADQFSLGVRSKCLEAIRTMCGSMIFEDIRRFA